MVFWNYVVGNIRETKMKSGKKFMKLIIILLFLPITFSKSGAQDMLGSEYITHRPATMAGKFYPKDPDSLRALVNKFADAKIPRQTEGAIVGMISPHAGYVYSGWVAGRAYKELIGSKYDDVIIIAPSHHERFEGSSIFNGEAYTTPLGIAEVDLTLSVEIARQNPLVKLSSLGHSWKDSASEHSIEVQLPFIQTVLPGVPIVPIVMGDQSNESINALIFSVVKAVKYLNRKVLIIGSSDLSHYHSHDQAREIDVPTVRTIDKYDYFKLDSSFRSGLSEACGKGPIVATMVISEMLGANFSSPLLYATSADSPYISDADTSRVVGYVSSLFLNSKIDEFLVLPNFTENEKRDVLLAARQGIENAVNNTELLGLRYSSVALNIERPVFVTIRKDGNLRGCIGHTFANDPLIVQIEKTAHSAAKHDPRFEPLTKDELDSIDIEVTVMTRLKRMYDYNEVRPGLDGVYLKLNGRTALFLPSVAKEQNWDKLKLLENLGIKAGLTKDSFKDPNAELYIFRGITIN